MKKEISRLLSLVLCAVMLLSAMPVARAAEDTGILASVTQDQMVETIIFLPAEQHNALRASEYAKIPASSTALDQLKAQAGVSGRYEALEAILKTNPFVMYSFTELIMAEYDNLMAGKKTILLGMILFDLLSYQDKIQNRPTNLTEVYEFIDIFLGVIKGQEDRITATEKLLAQDADAAKSYNYYLEVVLGMREAEQFPYLNVAKINEEKAFHTGDAKLDEAMNKLLPVPEPPVEPEVPVEPVVEVVRISGTNRIKTAIASADKLKEVLGVEKFQTIVVANAKDFPDALSGSYLAAVAKAPILLYANGQTSVTDYIRNNLAEGGMVYILGGINSVSEDIVTILSGINCERVAGSGRFATSLAIIEKADSIRGTKPEKVLICHALAFADSLSASATGLPILLVNGATKLNDAQKAYLESVRGAELYAIGGEKTIVPSLLEELNAYDANGAERVFGSGRELTSAAVARKFFPEAKSAALADSLDFPDGLAGGPVAYAMGAPLLLTRDTKEAIANAYVTEKGIAAGYIIGGAGAVSDASAALVFTAK